MTVIGVSVVLVLDGGFAEVTGLCVPGNVLFEGRGGSKIYSKFWNIPTPGVVWGVGALENRDSWLRDC
jgi:hypothetical protein